MLSLITLNYGIYDIIKIISKDGFVLYNVNRKKINIDRTNINKLIGTQFLSPIRFIKNKYLKSNIINHDIINNVKLRDQQLELLNLILQYISKNKTSNPLIYIGIYCPCGFGKTILTIDLICKLKLKTIIISPLKKIVEQWGNQIGSKTNLKCYLSIKGIYKINNDIKDNLLLDYDIIICPDKHLKNEYFIEYIKNNFSIIIIDEIHNYNLCNHNILNYFLTTNYFKYAFALSATPNDNCKIHFEKYIKHVDNTKKIKLYIYKNNYICSNNVKDVESKYYDNYNKINKVKDTKNLFKNIFYNLCLSDDIKRNNYIANKIKINFISGTKCIVLSLFKQHIKILYELLIKLNFSTNVFLYDVNNKSADIFNQINNLSNYIILATTSSLSEGIDICDLNTVHLLLPVKKNTILQSIGRIMRNDDDNKKFYFYNVCFVHEDVKLYLQDNTNTILKTIKNSDNIIIND